MSGPLIRFLVFFLVVQVVSPLCHAAGHSTPDAPGTAASTALTLAAPVVTDPATAPDAEPCWFIGAHVFESAETGAPLPGFVALAVVAIPVVLGLVARDKSWFPYPWKTPDRPPPSQAFLQVFLN